MNDLIVHFFDVGCGNMTLILFPNGTTYLFDCNLTNENDWQVLSCLSKAMGNRKKIDVFICSHRDSDHMRGIRKIHNAFPISAIRDPDVPGTTTTSPEYLDYMALRRSTGGDTIEARTRLEIGSATIRYMNGAHDDFSDANDQSVVMKIEFGSTGVLLAGDASFRPWKERILPFYSDEKIQADILLASHHGSLAFFDDPADERHYYTDHLKKIAPDMTLVSVGHNAHDLPDNKAMDLYAKYSHGSNKGNKLRRTDHDGNMTLTLGTTGGWSLKVNQ